MNDTKTSVQLVRTVEAHDEEIRASVRRTCAVEATSQPLDDVESISWGAVVDNLSAGGVGITICFPFRPGTYLAVDLHRNNGAQRTVLVRVIHVRDRFDGAWHLGCEFVKPLTESDVDLLI